MELMTYKKQFKNYMDQQVIDDTLVDLIYNLFIEPPSVEAVMSRLQIKPKHEELDILVDTQTIKLGEYQKGDTVFVAYL